MADPKPYYNHDHIWKKRHDHRLPLWGSYSRFLYKRILTELIQPRVPSGAMILDLGCGAGAFGTMVVEGGYGYVGIDESSVAIELGRSSYPSLELHCLDAVKEILFEQSPLTAKSYNVVSILNVLHCLVERSDRLQVLTNAAAALKDDGYVVIANMVGPLERSDYRQANAPRSYLTPENLISECQAVGLVKVVDRRVYPATERSPVANIELVLSLS